jgi:hypothetical protein
MEELRNGLKWLKVDTENFDEIWAWLDRCTLDPPVSLYNTVMELLSMETYHTREKDVAA